MSDPVHGSVEFLAKALTWPHGFSPVNECFDGKTWETATGVPLSVEIEVSTLLFALIRLVKPELVVETGCYQGYTTRFLGYAVASNGFGRVVSCDVEEPAVKTARNRSEGLPVEVRVCRGVELPELKQANIALLDSAFGERNDELELLPKGCIAVLHDTRICTGIGDVVKQNGGLLFNCARGCGLVVK